MIVREVLSPYHTLAQLLRTRRRHPSMMFIGRVSVQRYLAGTQFVLLTRGTVGSPTSKL